ncbi:MAG: FAD-binding protein [Chloroflexi bacterium]|nr:FAD-binding protein [Chloroflexota bacterium]
MAVEERPDVDVVVVGGGNAALSAVQNGARVLLLEKSPESERGGNTRFTGIYRFSYDGLDDIRALIPQMTDEEAEHIDVREYPEDQFYNKLGRAVLAQPRQMGFQIYDAKTIGLNLLMHMERYKMSKPIVADTIEDLAVQIDVDEEALGRSVDEFNAACPDAPLNVEELTAAVQSGVYNPAIMDGKATTGLEPKKCNWASRINTPPFYAYPVTCGVTFTYGGLKTDKDARVLDTEGNVIRGLYAAGEVAGNFYFNYCAGTGLTKGAVFGRISGRNAALDCR